MFFKDYIKGLKPLENYSVEIILNSGEKMIVENIPGKQGSLQLLQNHLGNSIQTTKEFDLKNFCEYYEQWEINPKGHHITINFLDKYNKEGGLIKRK